MYEREQAINPPEYDDIDEEQAEENRERQADADRYYERGGL
jgi:hypothetical protein